MLSRIEMTCHHHSFIASLTSLLVTVQLLCDVQTHLARSEILAVHDAMADRSKRADGGHQPSRLH